MCTYSTCDYYGNGGCAYERITSCRKPCPDGRYCHFRPTILPPTSEKHITFQQIDKARVRRLYNKGKTDEQIATVVGCTRFMILNWRRRMHLKANERQGPRKFSPTKAKELYDKGLTDGAISRNFGVTKTAICKWRQKNNLPAQSKRSVVNVV